MCISPNRIPNPYKGFNGKYAFMHDCVSTYINVPCGHCSECVRIKQLGIVQRASLESQSGWPFYVTVTYNPESLPIHICSDGVKIRYAAMSDATNMFKRLRNDNALTRPFRYFAVSELGSKRARPHFHFIIWLQKFSTDSVYTPYQLEPIVFDTILKYWQRNYGSRRSPIYRPLLTYKVRYIAGKRKSTYDCHYIQPSTLDGTTLDVSFYVTKYLLKPSKHSDRLQSALKLNLSGEEYREVWSLVRPRWFSSLNFGYGVYGLQPKRLSRSERLEILSKTPAFDSVKSSIARSRQSDFPKFFDLETGKSYPLSRYWRTFGNLYTVEDAIFFHYKNPNWREDNVSFEERDMSELLYSEEKFSKQRSIIDSHIFNTDLLFD